MKRSFLSFLLFAAVGLAPTLAMAIQSPFQAARVSGLTIGSPGANPDQSGLGTGSGTGGLVVMQNTGYVITNIASCQYFVDQGAGNTVAYHSGYDAIVNALIDGYGGNGDWTGTQGFTGKNAIADSTVSGIAYGFNNAIGWSTWGGVDLTGDSLNNGGLGDLLIRETYLGDSLLAGVVGDSDFSAWSNNYGLDAAGIAVQLVTAILLRGRKIMARASMGLVYPIHLCNLLEWFKRFRNRIPCCCCLLHYWFSWDVLLR